MAKINYFKVPPDPMFQHLVVWWHNNHCRLEHTEQCGFWYYMSRDGMRYTKFNQHFAREVYMWIRRPNSDMDTYREREIRNKYRKGTLTLKDLEKIGYKNPWSLERK